MEVLTALLVLVLLDLLALRFGYDTRETSPSKEHDLARLGVTWDRALQLEETHTVRTVRPPLPMRQVRRRLAMLLRGLARWLNPSPEPDRG
jgi:hypothetical protein